MDFATVIENKNILIGGIITTAWLTAATIVIALICGTALALARESAIRPLRFAVAAYSATFRALPGLTVLFFAYYGLPSFGIYLTAKWSAVIGLSLTSTAYITEIVRSGLKSVPAGQFEAARALGIPAGKALRRIIAPTALRVIAPALCSQFILVLKASSAASLVAVSELTGEALGLISITYQPIQFLIVIACAYLAMSTVVASLQWGLERKFAIKSAR